MEERVVENVNKRVDTVRGDLRTSKTDVIGEFQRLPMNIWEDVAAEHH